MAPELDGSDIEGDADADEDYSINYPFTAHLLKNLLIYLV